MIFFKEKVPEWQNALETDDMAYLERLCQKKSMTNTSPLGFSCLEVAYFLQKRKALADLAKYTKIFTKKRFFYVQPKSCDNVIRHDQNEFEAFFSCAFSSSLYFSDITELYACTKLCPWMFRSFFTRSLFDMGDIYRWYIHQQQVADVHICWISDILGYGLFSRGVLEKGTFVGEYTGPVRQVQKKDPDINAYCAKYPTKLFSKGYFVIDASEHANEMRFVNHSDTPNLSAVYICDRNLVHTAFIAKKNIQPGEELTIDYGKDFWRKRTKAE